MMLTWNHEGLFCGLVGRKRTPPPPHAHPRLTVYRGEVMLCTGRRGNERGVRGYCSVDERRSATIFCGFTAARLTAPCMRGQVGAPAHPRFQPRSLCLMCRPYHVCAAAPRVRGECSSLSACARRWKLDLTVTCGPLLFTWSGSMTRCGGHRLRARSSPALLYATFVMAGAAGFVRCC